MSLLLDSLFNSMAFGHFIVDTLNGQRAVLLTFWSKQTGMSNSTLGLVSMIYVWVASLSQPVFGWLTDRFGKIRLMAAGGILWMCSFFALALFLPVFWAIPCLILASLGSASFHPVATMQVTLRGRSKLNQRETTAASWFFLFGQFGYFFGPIVGGPLLQIYGPSGLLILTAPAVLIGLNAAWQLRRAPIAAIPPQKTEIDNRPALVPGKWFIVGLAVVAALQAWAQQNMTTFVPKYLSDLGQTPAVYGLVSGLFMGGSGIGNVLGGTLADRFGKQRVAMTFLALASIPLFLISQVGWSAWLYILVPLGGMFTGAVHSIIVVLAQRTIRSGMALASGLILGFMFSAGALGTMLSGLLADRVGFPPLFQMTAGLVILASMVTLFLREQPVR
jgi:MFS transporter, FSR family, fosmidomycin resistance protein